MGANLSAELDEARDITTQFLKIFAIEYTKMYLVALMKSAKKTLAKEAAGPQWSLLKCLKAPAAPVLKAGTVKKLSKYLKKWNVRYAVCKGDHLIDYYETEEKYNAGAKPLGTINMSNKNLHRDANDTVLNRIIALAEKCGVNVDEMPKPERYPDFTLEIYHEQKGPIYIECPGEEEWKQWCDLFERCRWQAPRLNLYEDKAHLFAFPKALWRTRWEVGMWGWWSGGGGEQSQLVDAINNKIADVVLYNLDRKLTQSWTVRQKIRNKFISTVDGIVSTAVGPAWKAAYSAVEAARPEAEPKIKEGMQPIVDAQKKIQDEICKMVEAGSKDFITEKVLPHLSPLLDIVFSPVVDGFKLVIRAFDVALERGREKYEVREDRHYMVSHHGYNSEFWDAERKIWDLYEPLWALRLVFEDIYPWSITGKARRRLRKTFDNALFTFETILEDGKESGKTWEQAADETRARLARDCRTGILRVLGIILFGVVENFFEKLVIRPARKLVKPLSDSIPAAIKDFVDPDDMLEELLYTILRRTCGMVFEPYTSRIDLGVADNIANDAPVVTRSAAVEDAPAPAAQTAAPAETHEEEHHAAAATSSDETAAAKKAEEDAAAAKAAEEAAAAARAAEDAAAAAKRAEEDAAAAKKAEEDAAGAKKAEEEAAAAEAAAAARAAEEAAAAAKKAEEDAAAARAAEEEAAAKAVNDAAVAKAHEEEAAAAAAARVAEEAAVASAAIAAAAARAAEEEEAAAAVAKAAEEEAAAAAEAAHAAELEAIAIAAAAKLAEMEGIAIARAEEEAAIAASVAAQTAEAEAAAALAEAEAIEKEAALVAEQAAREEANATAAAHAAEAAEREAGAAAEHAEAVEAAANAQDGNDVVEREAVNDTHAASMTEDASEGIELVYFQLQGRAHATRLVLEIGGVPFKDTRLSFQEYGALIGTGTFPLDTLPILKVEGQVVSNQSLAILRFAAELAELQLSEPEDILIGEGVLATAVDLAELFGTWFGAKGDDDKKRFATEIVETGFSFYAKHIEELLAGRSHNEVFVAQTISFVDVFLYSIVSFLQQTAASISAKLPTEALPKLVALVDAVAALPAVQSHK
ncbi:glutathione S-transferase, putative [Bodo saltans]|uniref:Glutathione S-transferase, putative n=1 Tax=Bodo saltans TaxID=75058 RepID=A0A0S4IPA2_BODSA|nr:glutathione S-transferase, putative [Bodo saltans]|eukprot:CUE90095.1 glutathione S-transferase, putative [Bodo saltans]